MTSCEAAICSRISRPLGTPFMSALCTKTVAPRASSASFSSSRHAASSLLTALTKILNRPASSIVLAPRHA
jgi:hypothetical protein